MIPAAACPVPVRGTETALTPSVDEEMAKVAADPPDVAGVKITCTVQLPPAGRVAPQVLGPVEKLAAEGPEIANPTLAVTAPPLFVMVSAAGALASPTCCAGNARLAGLTANAGGCKPVPLNETVCPGFVISETVNVPLAVPACVGVKTTLIAQFDLAANCVVQLLDNWKGPLTVAVIAVKGRSPVLLRVTVCAADVWPAIV